MTYSPSALKRSSNQNDPWDISTSDVESVHVSEEIPAMNSTKDRSRKATQFQDLGMTLKHEPACSPHASDPTAALSSTVIVSHSLSARSKYQLPSQQAYNQSPSRKRKYQVTTMADSPLKLRISWTGARPFGLDGSGDNPSPWDALAGEDARSDDKESVPDRRANVPSWQQAGLSAHASSAPPSASEVRFPILREGEEIYVV